MQFTNKFRVKQSRNYLASATVPKTVHLKCLIQFSRSSPSTAITWSALGCNVAPSGKVSSHVSAAAMAAKAATSTGRRQNHRHVLATNR